MMNHKIHKKDLIPLKCGHSSYVAMHGDLRIKRGLRPTAVLTSPREIRNPIKAYSEAKRLEGYGGSSASKILNVHRKFERTFPGIAYERMRRMREA